MLSSSSVDILCSDNNLSVSVFRSLQYCNTRRPITEGGLGWTLWMGCDLNRLGFKDQKQAFAYVRTIT